MNKELVAGIKAVAAERGLDANIIFEAIEAALVSTYKNRDGVLSNVVASMNRHTGEFQMFAEKEVMGDDELADGLFDARTMISESDAQAYGEVEIGDLVRIEFYPEDISRVAVQTAKQVILQRIREAERDIIYQMFKDRVGEVVSAQVRSVDAHAKTVAVTMNDRSEFVLKRDEQIPNDRLRRGDYVKLYVERVEKDNRGPYVKLSRTHRNLLRRLLEQEIPELREGTIEIKNIVREPGARSKVAVIATIEHIDAVGACVGMKGSRIKNIVNELAGERIDVVEWSDETHTFIVNAISPAKATGVILHEEGEHPTATVVAADDQLSLAIGKSGQNARLAARLTGWRIDIKSESDAQAEGIDLFELQQNMMKHDELATANRRLAKKQAPGLDPLDLAAKRLSEQASPDILQDALQRTRSDQPQADAFEEKWREAQQEQLPSLESSTGEDADDIFRQAAQKALSEMSYEEYTERKEAGLDEPEPEVEEPAVPEKPATPMTADMLRARRKAEGRSGPLNLDEIEVPAELLASYMEAEAARVDDEESETGGRGQRREPRRGDSPDARRYEDLMDE
ncbi:MAG: transcription termination/antitermination protein NusA [Caldilineaceae bacterium]|nr:transcription termination/antitermination protein NusA [Caldilineaceae bacterium]